MPIVFRQWIMPFYAFGTSRRIGFGGQAKEMRGEPNAISVATKWEPSNRPNAFFSDPMVCRTQVQRDLIQGPEAAGAAQGGRGAADGMIKPTTCPGLCGNRLH